MSGDATDKAGNPVTERVYVSVDGGMSDNIRPALYGADYAVKLANRKGSDETKLSRVVGMHCESGDIIVHECQLPADIKRGDVLAVPVTGAYGRTMASNYNQALIPAVVGVSEAGAHVMIRRQVCEPLHPLRGLLRHAANNVAIDKGRRAAPIRGTARRSRHIAFVE